MVLYIGVLVLLACIKLFISTAVYKILIFYIKEKLKLYNEKGKTKDCSFYTTIGVILALYLVQFVEKFFIDVLNCAFILIDDKAPAWETWYDAISFVTIYIFPLSNFFVQCAFLLLFYMLGQITSEVDGMGSIVIEKVSTSRAQSERSLMPNKITL